MYKAEKCFHTAAKHALKMGYTAENHRIVERLMRDYRRHMYSYDKCNEAQKVTECFEVSVNGRNVVNYIVYQFQWSQMPSHFLAWTSSVSNAV
jgi:hypothetical protein